MSTCSTSSPLSLDDRCAEIKKLICRVYRSRVRRLICDEQCSHWSLWSNASELELRENFRYVIALNNAMSPSLPLEICFNFVCLRIYDLGGNPSMTRSVFSSSRCYERPDYMPWVWGRTQKYLYNRREYRILVPSSYIQLEWLWYGVGQNEELGSCSVLGSDSPHMIGTESS